MSAGWLGRRRNLGQRLAGSAGRRRAGVGRRRLPPDRTRATNRALRKGLDGEFDWGHERRRSDAVSSRLWHRDGSNAPALCAEPQVVATPYPEDLGVPYGASTHFSLRDCVAYSSERPSSPVTSWTQTSVRSCRAPVLWIARGNRAAGARRRGRNGRRIVAGPEHGTASVRRSSAQATPDLDVQGQRRTPRAQAPRRSPRPSCRPVPDGSGSSSGGSATADRGPAARDRRFGVRSPVDVEIEDPRAADPGGQGGGPGMVGETRRYR